jgi:hypothetical protein
MFLLLQLVEAVAVELKIMEPVAVAVESCAIKIQLP